MVIEASDARRTTADKKSFVSFAIRVVESPAGAHTPDTKTIVTYPVGELSGQLRDLGKRTLARVGMIELGRKLAALLLPATPDRNSVYDLFVRSLDKAGPDRGVRLRLRLPPLLAALPWEYVYVDRAGNPDSIDGFLALNPRVAIVREEVQPTPSTLAPIAGLIKIVAAFALQDGMANLDLAQEQANLHAAVDDQPGLMTTFLEQATLDELLTSMDGAGVFHFAGHGQYTRHPQDEPGTYSGEGGLVLFDQYVSAEQLAVNLSRGGVRLAVLGGCETGRRDDISVWSGIAPTLVRAQAQVPAVIANQFTITDDAAIAFSKQLYQALVAGLSVEEAMAAGRIAAYNADTEGRDWGVPVLYLRPGDGRLFAGAADAVVREAARNGAEVTVSMRAASVAAGGYLTGAEVDTMRAGLLNITVNVGDVGGTVVGADITNADGGQANVDMTAKEVKGQLIGARIGQLGGSASPAPSGAGSWRCRSCQRVLAEAARFCTFCGTPVEDASTERGTEQSAGVPGDRSTQAAPDVAPRGSEPALQRSEVSQHIGRIESGGVAAGAVAGGSGDMTIGGQHTRGDTIDAQGSQGFVNRPTGPVSQHFGDSISVGDISNSSGVAIGQGASARVITMSLGGDAALRAELQQLIDELQAMLQRVPAAHATEAEAVAETAQQAVEQATREKPNKTMVQISAEGLKQAAQNLAAALPDVLPIAMKIAAVIAKFVV